jgi:SAM-dependent methyltransferase
MPLLTRDFLNERLVPELEQDTVQYFDHLRRYLFAQQYVAGKHVLEIACGTGYGGDILQRGGAQLVMSMDISLPALNYARHHWQGRFFAQADAEQLPLSDNCWEVIVSFETLEHLFNPRRFLEEARRVLRPHGYLILSTPNRLAASPGSDKPYSPYHTFEPTHDELIALLEAGGWQITALHGMAHSPQLQPYVHAATAPYRRETAQGIAWSAYLRWWLRALLPPLLYRKMQGWRGLEAFSLADAVIRQEADDNATYFIAVCRPN